MRGNVKYYHSMQEKGNTIIINTIIINTIIINTQEEDISTEFRSEINK